jgi:hypothetical protein
MKINANVERSLDGISGDVNGMTRVLNIMLKNLTECPEY